MGIKLELTWPGKDDGYALIRDDVTGKPRRVPYAEVQPRLLIEEADGCHGDPATDNMLIAGENLFVLKTLLRSGYAQQIRLVYIDPPYNTGNAFSHYDDGIEHSLWLTMMRDRLRLLRDLLRPDGSIWVHLDDAEAHYCRVLMDEIFGRSCFIADIAWKKRDGPPNDRKIGSIHEHILVYSRERGAAAKATVAELAFNLMPRTDKANAEYQVWPEPNGPDERGPFRKIDMTANAKGGRHVDSLVFPVRNPYTGQDVLPRKGTNWRHNRADIERLQAEGRIYWGVKGTATTPMRKLFASEAKQGMSAPSIWDDVGLNQHAAAELEALFGDKAVFDTPKPERLMQRIIEIGSNPGDWVLDCFVGSGTTAAVAHKMQRRWIGIEASTAAHLARQRLAKVIDGSDTGGISPIVSRHPSRLVGADVDQGVMFESATAPLGWTGGGGFRFYTAGKALMERDAEIGVWRLNYDNGQLIEAVCLHEGFRLLGDPLKHGQRGRHYAHVTDQFVTQGLIDTLVGALGDNETLTLYYQKGAGNLAYPEALDMQRIPQALFKEFAR